jgi:long-chain-fatty-acid--CoA ligase ACSBG
LSQVEARTQKIKPGNCCTLIYTSGTTGMPKGVMLSHDNYIWTKKSIKLHRKNTIIKERRSVSYLPLSHAAGQFSDIISPMIEGLHVYFADNKAMQGTIFKTLL